MTEGTRPTQIRLTPEDKRKIGVICERFGLPSGASAIRYAIETVHRGIGESPASTTSTTPATIARLRALVDQSGLARQGVAGRADMSPSMVTRALDEDRNPSIDTVRRILLAIGCDWADLDPIRT